MEQNSTVRRDWLQRQIQAGKMEAFDQESNTWIPVKFCQDLSESVSNMYNVIPFDFHAQGGFARKEADGTFWLFVHSKLNFKLRLK